MKRDIEDRIIRALRKQGRPLSSVQLSVLTGWHINQVRASLRVMTAEHRLVKYIGPIYDLAADTSAV